MSVLPRLNNYDDVYRQFRWNVPARYNIGVDVCDRWAALEPGRLAILHVRPDGRDDAISYGWLRETSNRLANVLRAHGIADGRVRYHGDLARLEVPRESWPLVTQEPARSALLAALRRCGFRHVTLDLRYFRESEGKTEEVQ